MSAGVRSLERSWGLGLELDVLFLRGGPSRSATRTALVVHGVAARYSSKGSRVSGATMTGGLVPLECRERLVCFWGLPEFA
jgi:hypothetical protein